MDTTECPVRRWALRWSAPARVKKDTCPASWSTPLYGTGAFAAARFHLKPAHKLMGQPGTNLSIPSGHRISRRFSPTWFI